MKPDEKTKAAILALLNMMITSTCRIRTPSGALIVIVKDAPEVACLDAWYDEHMAPAEIQ